MRRSASHDLSARTRARFGQRGVALLIVIVGLAVMGVMLAELGYNAEVDFRSAVNQRDEVRAYFLARSGIGMSRLLLKFQKRLDMLQIPNIGDFLKQIPGAQDALPQATGGAQPSSLSLQLWKMAKVDCYMLQGLVAEEKEPAKGIGPSSGKKFDFDDENPELAERQKSRAFGGFEGCFDVKLVDEEEKINLNKLDAPALTSQVLLTQLLAAFGDKRYEFLFEREDANRVKVAPTDLVIALRDWVDEDEVQSALNFSGQGEPFAKGFSDENYNYDRYDPRYRAKNARFDSLDELYFVHGVNDRFMAAFRDRLTVYPDINSRLNINTDDPLLLATAIQSIADPAKKDPRLNDPVFLDTIIQKLRAARMFALFGLSVTDFATIVESAGVVVHPSIKLNPQNQRFIGDKSSTFQLRSTGVTYGAPCDQPTDCGSGECDATEGKCVAVKKIITAVVRADDGLGRLVYWREE